MCKIPKRELGSYPQVAWTTGTLESYWTPLFFFGNLDHRRPTPKLEVNRLLVKRMTVGQVCRVDAFEGDGGGFCCLPS